MKKVRILFVHSCLVCGGAEQALYDLLALLDRNRFDITLLVLYQGGEWTEKFQHLGIPVLSPWSCQKENPGFPGKVHNKLLGWRIERALRRDGKKLVDLCTDGNWDLIVSYNLYDQFYSCLSGHAGTIRYIHGDMGGNPEFAQVILKDREKLSLYDRYICVSQRAARSFREMTGIQEGVSVHYNPIDSRRVRAMSLEPVEGFENQVCAVGRLSHEKGFARLIRIHGELLREGISHHLTIVGEGPEREKLEALIEELGLSDSVTLAGYTANPYPYMRGSRFLVCSSYTEGLPVVVMEALSLGIPVVSAAPSIGESFGEENCGLITEKDDESLKSGLKKMLTDRSFYDACRLGAEKRSTQLRGSVMVREVEEAFLDLLREKRGEAGLQ